VPPHLHTYAIKHSVWIRKERKSGRRRESPPPGGAHAPAESVCQGGSRVCAAGEAGREGAGGVHPRLRAAVQGGGRLHERGGQVSPALWLPAGGLGRHRAHRPLRRVACFRSSVVLLRTDTSVFEVDFFANPFFGKLAPPLPGVRFGAAESFVACSSVQAGPPPLCIIPIPMIGAPLRPLRPGTS